MEVYLLGLDEDNTVVKDKIQIRILHDVKKEMMYMKMDSLIK